MNVGELQVKQSADGELYFRIPDELLNRLGWEVGDDIKFIPKDNGFIMKKVRYEQVSFDLDEDDYNKCLRLAHEAKMTFDDWVSQVVLQNLCDEEL